MAATEREIRELADEYAASVARTIYERDGEEALKSAVSRATVLLKQDSIIAGLSDSVAVAVSNWTTLNTVLSSAAVTPDKTAVILREIKACLDGRDATKLGPLFVMLYGSVKQQFGIG